MASIYENIIRPLLFRMEPEQAHDRGRTLLMTMGKVPGLCPMYRRYNQVRSDKPVRLFGLDFPNRVGLAAGMDKDGEFARAVEALGFGHAEVGTVTPQGQPGNPRPRLFRFPQYGSLVNRMGFNNKGAEAMLHSLEKSYPKGKRGMPVGVNIGKAKATPLDKAVEDYLSCFRTLADQADYFTINISSPNTQGLRELQSKAYLRELLVALRDENKAHAKKLGHEPHPLLLKIAPDLSFPEIDLILEVLLDLEYSGVIATNTTIARPEGFPSSETGGLSGGEFIRRRSTEVVNYIYRATSGKLPIVGVGGIDSPESAGEKLDAGASLVQIYTGWVYRGPFFARELAKALRARDNDWV
ncbi:quinone-dependent dihydroorotate dehydrogenase [Coraliomargarita parva]|uniref:quinone-dependent dihydroorotate dehydrogenase n=1 Tax=Coraliomargarita parva TaxID=3014050 RepID=UPI0022B4980A|nr:quinone-dependent dihydroorotate dehydrogenase [Coraliomargarita parva]